MAQDASPGKNRINIRHGPHTVSVPCLQPFCFLPVLIPRTGSDSPLILTELADSYIEYVELSPGGIVFEAPALEGPQLAFPLFAREQIKEEQLVQQLGHTFELPWLPDEIFINGQEAIPSWALIHLGSMHVIPIPVGNRNAVHGSQSFA